MTDRPNAADVVANYCRTIAEDVEGAADPADAAMRYVTDALDADYLVDSRGNVKAVHLIVGTGGPHVEVRNHVGADGVMVHAWWWSDYAELHAYAPALAAELDVIADAWQGAHVPTGVHR